MSDPVARQHGVHHTSVVFSQRPLYNDFPDTHNAQGSFMNGLGHEDPTPYHTGASLPISNSHNGYDAIHRHRPTPETSFQSYSPSAQHASKPTPSLSVHHPGHNSLLLTNNPEREAHKPPTDHANLLLSLAEEYLGVAYQLTSKVENHSHDAIPKEYYRLIATALGCLETVLAKCKLQPAQEAVVRLRYATILYEETENEMEAEEALSKGITLADRHKLFALKYNMQHLLVRILFVTRAPAAFKFLDGIIKDAEAYRHFAWVYALSFLKISLHLKMTPGSRQETTFAFITLTRVNSLAEHRGDVAIQALVATMKAWLCLKASNTHESFEEAQTLLAAARALQVKDEVRRTPQIAIMVAFVDLCCYLQRFDPVQANEKLKHVHDTLQLIEQADNWLTDGSFKITILRDEMIMPGRSDGIVTAGAGNSISLLLNWYPKNDIYTVGYLLSGITIIHQSKPPPDKPEQMLRQGISKGSYDQQQSDNLPRPIISRGNLQLWRQHLNAYMRLYLAFIQCMRSNWDSAYRHLKEYYSISKAWSLIPPPLKAMASLLEGTYSQGTGSLPHALDIYQSLVNLRAREPSSLNHMMDDICRIAALNSLMILRNPDHDGHQSAMILFSNLGRDCPNHPNRQIQAAYNLVNSTLSQSTTIIARKQTLQLALNAAKVSHSNTSLCISLSLMHWYFFRDQVTEQAEKSARAAQNMANRVENKMWVSTTAGRLGDHLEAAGRSAEAAAAFMEGWKAAEGLPPKVKLQLGWTQEGEEADVEMSESIY